MRSGPVGSTLGTSVVGFSSYPKVTVVLPTYNRGHCIRDSATSVLTQSFRDLELLIVDDGSTENLAASLTAVVKDRRTRIVRRNENKGAAAARNTGVSLASGDYIAFVDSDDVWHSDKLLHQIAWMESNNSSVSCTGFNIVTDFRPEGEQRLVAEVSFQQLHWGCGLSPGSTMIVKKALWDMVGPFDEALRRLEDWDWLLRCAQITPIGVVPEILALVRVSARDTYPLEHVCDAAATIERYVLAEHYSLSKKEIRILLSTLYGEVAAAAFRRLDYGKAGAYLLRSLFYNPFKRPDYFWRIGKAVAHDMRALTRALSGRCQSKILNTWSGHRTAQIDPEKCRKINGLEIRF
jgi:glycosyltransferase involved in cell wall biosynthesis